MGSQLFLSKLKDENISISRKILDTCKEKKIFLFSGRIGAGKTTLIKDFCQILGVREEVVSPTFSLVHEYEGANGSIYHFDFYRIQHEEEAYDIGIEEYFDSGAYCFVEWPEKIKNMVPDDSVLISIDVLDHEVRQFTVEH